MAPPDATFTISPSDGGTGGDAGTNPDCTVKTDPTACTVTTDCTIKQSGFTTVTHAVLTTLNGMVSGTQSSKTTKDSDGSVLSDCSLSYTWTKQ
jgi:hypothetical protein